MQDKSSGPDGEEDASNRGDLVRIDVKGSDILGVGAAAKTPAGKSIADAFARMMDAISDPVHTFLKGHAETSVEARHIERIARAEAKAELIRDSLMERLSQRGESELRQRAGQRVLADEMRKQTNLEGATEEAIRSANSRASESETARPIPDDWMQKWALGAQYASNEQVRSIYAKILADKASNKEGGVGGPSLKLLAELDGDLAACFQTFAEFVLVYGSYPCHSKINPGAISERNLRILTEIGFLNKAALTSFNFHEVKISFGGGGRFALMHDTLLFTQRGLDIANSLFAKNNFLDSFGRTVSDADKISTYLKLIHAAEEVGPRPIALSFPAKDGDGHILLLVGQGNAKLNFENVEHLFESKNVEKTKVRFAILKALLERNCEIHYEKTSENLANEN